MKRKAACFVLTLLVFHAHSLDSQDAHVETDISLRQLRPVSTASGGRLCVGTRNAVRAELALRGPVPSQAVRLRLALVLPGGDPAGLELAEGSVAFSGTTVTRSFTFVNVEVPARLQGRGAVLEVRATLDRGIIERNLSNNVATLGLERATDWSCSR